MSETLSIRLDTETKSRLDKLAERCNRSKSYLAAQAIAAYLHTEEWQLAELQAGIADLDAGLTVSHDATAAWMRSWGTEQELPAPNQVPAKRRRR